MNTKKHKSTGFTKRVKETIDAIYEFTVNDPLTIGFASLKKNKLFSDCGSILRSAGLVKNLGNKTNPIYIWEGEQPDAELCKKVVKTLREMMARKKAGYRAKEKPVLTPAVIEYPKPSVAICLVNIPDKDIWNELKNRGYVIHDNRLCKMDYLD